MDAESIRQLTLLLDLKKNRISITRKTLQEIGNPEYILLLVKPEERTLVISHGDSADKRAHRVPLLKPDTKKKHTIELYSKSLMTNILSISDGLHDNLSYRIQGNIIPYENIIRFYMDKAEPMSKLRNK